MKKIKSGSAEFENFKEGVERNKIKNTGTKIDVMVEILKQNNLKISQTTEAR